MRLRLLCTAFIVVVVLVGCGSSADDDSEAATPSSSAVTTSTTSTTSADNPAGQLANQYGARYCEVLTVKLSATNTTAEVWGTQGLSDCPQAGFATIDPAAAAAAHDATTAIVNGPRYWVLDDVVANAISGSGEVERFGGLQMRSIATVDLGKGVPDRSPYRGVSVNRDTEFSFDAGRRVYELTASDGSVYVMQSYSIQVEPTLTIDALTSLGDRLQVPAGWAFSSRILDERLVVEDIDGVATVIQDELQNSYQLRSRA